MTDPPPAEWSPDPRRFLEDVEAKPAYAAALSGSRRLHEAVDRIDSSVRSVLFLGMGSSRYAALDTARWLRGAGVWAVAEYASAVTLPPPQRELLVVAVSASGQSAETVAATERYAGIACTVAVTEDPASVLAQGCDLFLPLEAGVEAGGVACRSFLHTGLVLRLLEARLSGRPIDFARLCGTVAEASADLLERRSDWLSGVSDLLDGPDGVHCIAPAERWSCAAQSALMLREGPRRSATASETGDWNHVDVYLTKTTDYRALLMTGSPYDDEALEWLRARGSTVVTLGGKHRDVAATVQHRGSADPDVAVHVDTLVAELLAARWWRAEPPRPG